VVNSLPTASASPDLRILATVFDGQVVAVLKRWSTHLELVEWTFTSR
jgi:hypothetical protein